MVEMSAVCRRRRAPTTDQRPTPSVVVTSTRAQDKPHDLRMGLGGPKPGSSNWASAGTLLLALMPVMGGILTAISRSNGMRTSTRTVNEIPSGVDGKRNTVHPGPFSSVGSDVCSHDCSPWPRLRLCSEGRRPTRICSCWPAARAPPPAVAVLEGLRPRRVADHFRDMATPPRVPAE